jgi:thiamine-phosphate pyrophosphorylase
MSFRRSFDLSVYFIADPSVCGGRDVAEVVRMAAEGGATMVQLRDKSGDVSQIEAYARAIQVILKPLNIPFLLNDHVALAAKLKLDGVHIGQDDTSPHEARRIMGQNAIIGLTAFTPDHFAKLDPTIIDYAGTGPFYNTLTKPDKPVLGPEGFSELVKRSPVPVVGIGGITPENASAAITAGAKGVAMMRSISEADDPAFATRRFLKSIKH